MSVRQRKVILFVTWMLVIIAVCSLKVTWFPGSSKVWNIVIGLVTAQIYMAIERTIE